MSALSSRRRWLALGLWLLLWASLNTGGPQALLDAEDTIRRIHALRTWLPWVAGYVALLVWLADRPIVPRAFTPLGAFLIYGAIGLLVSPIMSVEPLVATYWAGAYVSVLLILNPQIVGGQLEDVSRIIRWNWRVVAVLCLSLSGVALLAMLRSHLPSWYSILAYVPSIAEMPMVRATGIARYAALVGIIAANRMFVVQGWGWRACWGLLVFTALSVILACRSHGAMLAFGAGGMTVLLLRRKFALLAWLIAAGIILFLGLNEGVRATLLRDKTLTNFLSGRPKIWDSALQLVTTYPLLGGGFHAERVFFHIFRWPYESHVSNAPLHAFVQTGLIGGIVFLGAWVLTASRLYQALRRSRDWDPAQRNRLIEVGAVLVFFAARSCFESSGAFFGVDWLLVAPLVLYVQLASRTGLGLG